MADTRGRGSSPSRAIRNRSRERERVKERETNDQKVTIDREKVQILICMVSFNFWSREMGSRSKVYNLYTSWRKLLCRLKFERSKLLKGS